MLVTGLPTSFTQVPKCSALVSVVFLCVCVVLLVFVRCICFFVCVCLFFSVYLQAGQLVDQRPASAKQGRAGGLFRPMLFSNKNWQSNHRAFCQTSTLLVLRMLVFLHLFFAFFEIMLVVSTIRSFWVTKFIVHSIAQYSTARHSITQVT